MEQVKIIAAEKEGLTVALSGEIDFGNAEAFYDAVMAKYAELPADICFDCAQLEFIDSTTLGTFVKILKTVQKDGRKVKLIDLQPKIKKLFLICALDSIMEIA